MAPLLDVVMVAYRSEEDLPDLLAGLKGMTSSEHALHFFDNTGNPKTLTMAWNDLAAQGSAEYIAFLNTDIRLSPEWDERLIGGLNAHADAGAVLPVPISNDWPQLVDPSRQPYPDRERAPAPDAAAMRYLANLHELRVDDYSFGGSCNAAFYAVLMRRSTWADLKGFDERFRFYGQDHDFQRRMLYRLSKYAKTIVSAPVWHRCSGSVLKAMQHGDVLMRAEYDHCNALQEALKAGTVTEWDRLPDAERAAVRGNRSYNTIPRPPGKKG